MPTVGRHCDLCTFVARFKFVLAGMLPVTPYIWQYQPETGKTAGARQDYGSVINWLSSSPQLYQRIAAVNKERNVLDKQSARLRNYTPLVNDLPLSGTGYHLNDGKRYRKLTRDMLPFPHGWQVYEGGVWKPVPVDMAGAGNALSTYPTVISASSYKSPFDHMRGGSLSNSAISVAHSNGMTPFEFACRYPPVVYNRPFSEPMYYFPKEFNPLWDPSKDFRGSSAITMKYRNIM